jgi:hypothetical protein
MALVNLTVPILTAIPVALMMMRILVMRVGVPAIIIFLPLKSVRLVKREMVILVPLAPVMVVVVVVVTAITLVPELATLVAF